MNLLIKRLYKQASQDPIVQSEEQMVEKFSELLIKEFLVVCKDTQISFLMYGMNDREADGAIAVQEQLKKYFGLN